MSASHCEECDSRSEGEKGGRLRNMLADIVFPARSWPQPQSEDCLLSFCQRHTVSNRAAAAAAAKAGRIHSLLKLWAARGWIRVWNDVVDFLTLPPWNILGNTKVTCDKVKRLSLGGLRHQFETMKAQVLDPASMMSEKRLPVTRS